MFRDAATIDAERTAAKVREIQANWERSADSWFDGSVDSIDKRLGQCNKMIGQCRAASVRLITRPEATQYMRLARELESDQRALTDMRHDLLYAAADRHEWAPGYSPSKEDEEARAKLKDPASGRLHPGESWGGVGNYWDAAPSKAHYSKTARRWIELESRNFFADNHDAADDLHELSTRAAYYARSKTSTVSPQESRAIVAGFVGKVEELGRKAARMKTAAVATTVFEDFPDSLLY